MRGDVKLAATEARMAVVEVAEKIKGALAKIE